MVDFEEILDYGMRSQLAYQVLQPEWYLIEKVGWRSPGPTRLEIEEVPDAEVNTLVEVCDSHCLQWIAIRGSSNLRNWVFNVQYEECSVDEGNTVLHFHNGFYRAAQDVYRAIRPHLSLNYKTRITGHSLGGAIATILMIFLKYEGYSIEKCITFGQPKVTNKEGANVLQDFPLLRVINREDVVPTLPPSTPLTLLQGGYEHFGPEIHLQSRNYTYFDSHSPHISCGESFWANLSRAVTQKDIGHSTDNIKEHFMQHYLLNVMSNMDIPDPKLEQLIAG